jgi:hypothetical protein
LLSIFVGLSNLAKLISGRADSGSTVGSGAGSVVGSAESSVGADTATVGCTAAGVAGLELPHAEITTITNKVVTTNTLCLYNFIKVSKLI